MFRLLIILMLVASTAYAVQDADNNGAIDIIKGGTNATTVSDARTTLGVTAAAEPVVVELGNLTPVNDAVIGFNTTGHIEAKTAIDVDVVLYDEAPTVDGQITQDLANNGIRIQIDGTDYAINGAGDIEGVTAGTGLSGGGTTGTVTLDILPTYTQRRVSSSCAAGSSIRAIAEDGTVTCEIDDTSSGAGYVSTVPTYSDEACTAGQYAFSTTLGYVCVSSGDWNTFSLTDWNNPQPVTYTLTVTDPGNNDAITCSDPDLSQSINCGNGNSVCTATAADGASITGLTATADTGRQFDVWTGDVTSTENPTTTALVMSANRAVGATFSASSAWSCPASTTCLYVDTDASNPSPPTYSTLFDAEAALPASPTEAYIIRCSGATADTTAVDFDGGDYSTYGLTVLGDGTYTLTSNASQILFRSYDEGITVDGLIFTAITGASDYLVQLSKSTIFRNNTLDGGGFPVAGIYVTAAGSVIYNNIITGTDSDFYGCIRVAAAVVAEIYNNILGNLTATYAAAIRGDSATVVKNNIIFDIAASYGAFYDDTMDTSYNICTESDCTGTGSSTTATTSTLFVSSTDYHIKDSSSESYETGTDLSGTFTTDKDGDTRTTPWDCGAYIH